MTYTDTKAYFDALEYEMRKLYGIAETARAKGLDPSEKPEIARAHDLAARVESLVGPDNVAQRIRELNKKLSREEIAFKISEEIIYGKFGRFDDDEKAAEQAIRTSLAILNEGVTTSPLEGIASVRIKRRSDGGNYLAIYFASPIRASGGTEAAQTVLVGDFIRKLLHLDKYDPTEDEVERFVEEIELYRRQVTHLQYPSSADEIRKTAKNLPIEVTGEPTEQLEVSGHRDLPRIGTNKLRGGAILVLNDGVISKAPKLKKIIDKIGGEGWEWLDELRTNEKRDKSDDRKNIKPNPKYLSEVIAGRPVFSYPSRVGGFRLRYGRSRNTGLAAIGLNPATMVLLDGFIAPGTQLAVERPGKGAIALPVSSIEGPIVKLTDGSVKAVDSQSEALECLGKIAEILFLGDMLVAYGEFLENNHPLVESGYCEEWWQKEATGAIKTRFAENLLLASQSIGISQERLRELSSEPFSARPTAHETLRLARQLGIPLHPRFTYFWHDIVVSELLLLREALKNGTLALKGHRQVLQLSKDKNTLNVLEKLGIPFDSFPERIELSEHHLILFEIMAIFTKTIGCKQTDDVYELIRELSGLILRKKAPVYIGARMGRPEKAMERKMKPPVHGLFPVGLEGGISRSINKAAEKRVIKVELARRKCLHCGEETLYCKCQNCGNSTIIVRTCTRCQMMTSEDDICPKCGGTTSPYRKREIDIHKLFADATMKTGSSPRDVKGVQGLTSRGKEPELLEKAILRAKYSLYVFKDGTTRYDATDAPLTHFTAREANVSVEVLTELGYEADNLGNRLVSEDQILELKVQDIILPSECAEYLLRVSKFVDDLLKRVYGLEPFYRANTAEDLVGHLAIGLAPHTSVGIVGRIVGFTKTSVCFAHPYWHAAKRRNCDGDEDSVILALDALLNFSKSYLPSSRGGMMDAPLIVSTAVDPEEVDDEAHSFDLMSDYPLEFYQKTLEHADPKSIEDIMEIVSKRLGKPEQYVGFSFSHPTNDIAGGPRRSSYTLQKSTQMKLKAQLAIATRIRAVDSSDVARKVLETHLIPDLLGCLRAFTSQKFRCMKCNAKYRRVPLIGHCLRCGGKILTTVSRNTVIKYFDLASGIVKDYDVGAMFAQRIEMIEQNLTSVFEGKTPVQKRLTDFSIAK
ncbi:MAG: DNA polymerase II large subunit [Candidatus Atabeyarchaeum deiterrae]